MALGIPGRDRGERHHRDSLPDLLQEEKMAVVIDTIKKLNAGALSSDCRQSPDRKVRAFLGRASNLQKSRCQQIEFSLQFQGLEGFCVV